MPRYIAFLRAINVGGRNVKMARLRAIFESLDLDGVETFIASGNVAFDTDAEDLPTLEREVEQLLERELGFEVTTFIRSADELTAIAEAEPFPAADVAAAHGVYTAFLKTPPGEAARHELAELRSDVDDFHLHDRELFWLCRTRVSESRFSGAVLERTLGMPATFRNVTTVRKLAAKYPA